MIGYIEDLVTLPQLRFLEDIVKEPQFVFQSTSVIGHFNAAVAGLGLAFLHCFAAEPDNRLVRVLPEKVQFNREFWLSVHEDLRHVARIEAVCDFLTELLRDNQAFLMGRA